MINSVGHLRDSADLLFEQGKYDSAFTIYDEVYKNIWQEIGKVQAGLSEFALKYLNNNFSEVLEFKRKYTMHSTNAWFKKNYGSDLDDVLNEFIFSLNGRLQCLCFSQVLLTNAIYNTIIAEFLLLYTLILSSGTKDWINNVLKLYSPVYEEQKFRKFKVNVTDNYVKARLIEDARKIKSTDWYALNINLLEYLAKTEHTHSDFYRSISNIIGPYSSRSKKKYSKSRSDTGSDKKDGYKRYERYERYEKYESYERFEKNSSHREYAFDFNNSTDYEKSLYFGNMFGLKGQVTRAFIRKKYIELISQYHPDKVAELGPELIELAEKKTKEINLAFEWFRNKYDF
ncbi:MAG: hypothetical protein C4539_04875 [Ignavibacteriales bacterium]|nr:MAG: hypothetical protein C4539_04875 [Ignavibacteriales bacterium]